MDGEHRAMLIKTLELIAATRGEISRLREEIELTRSSLDRSHKLLSRNQPSAHRVKEPAKPL